MPELPEVESIKNQLNRFLTGHKILDVEVKRPGVFSGDKEKVLGAKIIGTRRFAKVLCIDLSNEYSIIAHVKLTGQFIYRGPNLKEPPALSKKVVGGAPGPHTHVIFKLDKGAFLYYNDIRRFGWVKIVQSSNLKVQNSFLAKLGPEPFDGLTLEIFKEILGKTKRAVKVVIMDQAKMGGVGNIYANDALWLAKINPKRPANSLTGGEQTKLYDSILKVLGEGIKRGGASELSFVTPDGGEGSYQKHFLAYGQQGKLCSRCKKAKMIKVTLGGRGTYYCPICQP
jgi:formamidopyrimidine-DNA glycosylase